MKTIGELLDLSGQVAIVTGGAQGIGAGICYRLAEAGASVVVADIDIGIAQDTALALVERGWRAEAVKVDVASSSDLASMVEGCVRTHGRLDVLVNNAGIYPLAPVSELTDELFDRVMRVNLRSVALATRAAAEVMKAQGGGRIVNVTSIDAIHPSMVGLAPYDASKHGVWGFTMNAALELAPYRIWVNAIAPGGIVTPGTTGGGDQLAANAEAFLATIPMRRMGDPDEIGTVALFLASDMASYLTGAQIVVDGGALLS